MVYIYDPADGAEFVDPNATFTWTGGFGAKLHTAYIGTSFDEVIGEFETYTKPESGVIKAIIDMNLRHFTKKTFIL